LRFHVLLKGKDRREDCIGGYNFEFDELKEEFDEKLCFSWERDGKQRLMNYKLYYIH